MATTDRPLTTDPVTIDTGDTVFHRPTGETWTVAYVRDDVLSWCGWPEGTARVSDCELREVASDEDRVRLLQQMARMGGNDARGRYARWRLGIREVS
jgi:hypothetical protein